MKNQIKMIVTDLDGTLLRTDKTISDFTRATLAQCRSAGIRVVYATGRGGSAKQVAPSDLFDGRITMNGAVACEHDTIVYSRLIPYMTARPLLIACDGHGLKSSSELSGMHYANFAVTDVWQFITTYEITDFSRHAVDAEKLYMITTGPEDVAFIEKHIPDSLYMTVSRDKLAQIMHKEATKSKAVAVLAGRWGIAQTEIAAFGDDLNDMDLLTYAGVGVAVGNAVTEVRAAADCICPTNDEDGLATWIKENVLSGKR